MAWSDVQTTYHAHLVAAGLLVTPTITSIVRGEPSALTTVPVLAYWWGGRRPSMFGGATLSSASTDEALVTTLYVPDGIRLPNRNQTVEDYMREVIQQIHTRVLGDAHLGEFAIGIDIDELLSVSAGWAVLSNTTARTATFTCWAAMVDQHTIAN
jgi:hypothetical protein